MISDDFNFGQRFKIVATMPYKIGKEYENVILALKDSLIYNVTVKIPVNYLSNINRQACLFIWKI